MKPQSVQHRGRILGLPCGFAPRKRAVARVCAALILFMHTND
jgi:hypothetical protein